MLASHSSLPHLQSLTLPSLSARQWLLLRHRQYILKWGHLSSKHRVITDPEFFKFKDVAQLLLDANLLVNARDTEWTSPLHCAWYVNASEIVELLLSRGSDLRFRGRESLFTIAHLCCQLFTMQPPTETRNWFIFWFGRTHAGHDRSCLLLSFGIENFARCPCTNLPVCRPPLSSLGNLCFIRFDLHFQSYYKFLSLSTCFPSACPVY